MELSKLTFEEILSLDEEQLGALIGETDMKTSVHLLKTAFNIIKDQDTHIYNLKEILKLHEEKDTEQSAYINLLKRIG